MFAATFPWPCALRERSHDLRPLLRSPLVSSFFSFLLLFVFLMFHHLFHHLMLSFCSGSSQVPCHLSFVTFFSVGRKLFCLPPWCGMYSILASKHNLERSNLDLKWF